MPRCGLQTFDPSRSATATLSNESSNSVPRVAAGRARSQMPNSDVEAAFSLAWPVGSKIRRIWRASVFFVEQGRNPNFSGSEETRRQER